jgi:hypothetical protein
VNDDVDTPDAVKLAYNDDVSLTTAWNDDDTSLILDHAIREGEGIREIGIKENEKVGHTYHQMSH